MMNMEKVMLFLGLKPRDKRTPPEVAAMNKRMEDAVGEQAASTARLREKLQNLSGLDDLTRMLQNKKAH